MRCFSRDLIRGDVGRRYVCAMLLSAYVLTAAGISLPIAGRPLNSGEAFPCATSRCGCDSAERCWRSCCCHTLAARLAWARRHGVRPPTFVVANARSAGIDLAWLANTPDARQSTADCCTAKRQNGSSAYCPMKPAAHTEKMRTCCAKRHIETSQDENVSDRKNEGIVAWRALACRGHSMHWLAAVPTLIMSRPERLNFPPLVSRVAPAASEAAESVSESPAVPPPEFA
jgi:hypothetical protein